MAPLLEEAPQVGFAIEVCIVGFFDDDTLLKGDDHIDLAVEVTVDALLDQFALVVHGPNEVDLAVEIDVDLLADHPPATAGVAEGELVGIRTPIFVQVEAPTRQSGGVEAVVGKAGSAAANAGFAIFESGVRAGACSNA